ncbi:sensor histidine kinase [Pedobacter nutrimenti]|jgi:sensor histidine kinase YesM|uniref:Histidine kinase n=1 Tax=Pedobacter nutrimenti TaxID=1241337 RepID=A0A318UEB2_9SPHI|nr:histidine kinase [Pedobacter nutrimenti]PYF74712.1 histidine kinase [Pedobacter nutrimenti]
MNKAFKIKEYLEPLLHALIWGCLFFILWQASETLGPFRKTNDSIYPVLIWSGLLNLTLFYVNSLYFIPKFIAVQRYSAYFIWVIFLYISIVIINSVLDHFYSITLLSSEKEPLLDDVVLNMGTKIFILSMSLGYGLTKHRIKDEKVKQGLIKEKLIAELKYLRGQINPHFLFNSLNLAYSSATKNGDHFTADIIEKLSGLMRYVLYESNSESVWLEKEINYIDSYTKLQLQRLAPELADQISYRLHGEWKKYHIAPMILIPFIENVFKHGIIWSKNSEVLISIHLEANRLVLETRNSITIKKDESIAGIGLKNASERLQLLYPERHSLWIDSSNDVFYIKLTLDL